MSIKLLLMSYAASLVLLLLSTSATAQTAKMVQECEAEIEKADRAIADARKAPQYKSENGRQALTSADRSLNQARKHAAKGEPRNCVSAAQKSRAQLSAQRGK
jgi:biopolymer transport protein ExbB/TolQ